MSAHLAGALSEGGGGDAKGGHGGGKGLLDTGGDLEAVGLHGHGCHGKRNTKTRQTYSTLAIIEPAKKSTTEMSHKYVC